MTAEDLTTLPQRLSATRLGLATPAPRDLPGPTGESNRLSLTPRGPILCMGPGATTAAAQAQAISALGGIALATTGSVPASALTILTPLAGVIWWGDTQIGRQIEDSLSTRPGPIIPLMTGLPDAAYVLHERHVCIDTTAAGGNAALLAEVGGM